MNVQFGSITLGWLLALLALLLAVIFTALGRIPILEGGLIALTAAGRLC